MTLLPFRAAILACLASLTLATATVADDYTLTISDQTGLTGYKVYVMGFSTKSNLVLGPAGTLVAAGATVDSYPVGTGAGEIQAITLDTLTEFNGGRFYFFVVADTEPSGPSVPFGKQPPNPGTDPSYPPYSIVEITIPAPTGTAPNLVASNATIDVQTVDGFVFPITSGLNNLTTPGDIYGQPTDVPAVTRASIFTAYTTFMTAQGAAGTPYLDMVYNPNSIEGQAGGILNPGAYLTAQDSAGNFLNPGSSLHTVFDAALNTLFASSTLEIQGVASNPAGVAAQAYTVAPATVPYADTGIDLPALKFTGVTTPSDIFYIFNPVGVSVISDDAGNRIQGSIYNGTSTLTLDAHPGVPDPQVGMYVFGPGIPLDSSSRSSTTISEINGDQLTLWPPLNGSNPAANSDYSFSTQPELSSAGNSIKGTINNVTGLSRLVLDSAVSGLAVDMFVAGVGLSPVDGKSVTKISAIDGATLTLTPPLMGFNPATNSQYLFSKQPYVANILSPGQMVFGNTGFFGDSAVQIPSNAASQSVLASLENFFVAAINRGVGIADGALNPAPSMDKNGTSAFWGTQSNWYPGANGPDPAPVQNLFSLFMHVGDVSGTPIFLRPAGAVANARSQTMGSAYGFAYDENAGPVPPAPAGQPEVPSKFDGTVTPGSSVQITLGPWGMATPTPTPTATPTPTPMPTATPISPATATAIVQAQRDLRVVRKGIQKAKRVETGAVRKQTIQELKFVRRVAFAVIADPTNTQLVIILKQTVKAVKIKNPDRRAKKLKKLQKRFKRL